MELHRIGGGLLAGVAVAIPMIAQAMGLHLSYGLGVAGITACCSAALVGIVLAFWPMRKAGQAMVGDSYNNSGNNFGHMGPINIGKQPFELTQDQIDEALRRVIPGRPIIVQAVGNQRAWAMGQKLTQALTTAGHTAVLRTIGMLSPPPDQPLTISLEGNATVLTIAPNV
jgi:hypothetical protein